MTDQGRHEEGLAAARFRELTGGPVFDTPEEAVRAALQTVGEPYASEMAAEVEGEGSVIVRGSCVSKLKLPSTFATASRRMVPPGVS